MTDARDTWWQTWTEWRLLGIAALLTLLGLILGIGLSSDWRSMFEPRPDDARTRSLSSHYYPLDVTIHGGIVANVDVQDGGGITQAANRIVAVTGAGAFYVLTKSDAAVGGRRIPVASPANASAFDHAMQPAVDRSRFRVHDLAMRAIDDGWQIFASHHAWDEDQRCLRLAVSRAVINGSLDRVIADWSPVFRTSPCFAPVWDGLFSGDQAGGRLAWVDQNRLIVTLGDHDFNLWNRTPAAAQSDDFDYGKTFVIDVETGRAERFTMGHRNPAGLYVDPGRRVWSTEHGPRGGDELNLLVAGGNYGWPNATEGTAYSGSAWGPEVLATARDDFRPPVFAWVPAIGVSQLIGVEGDRFPLWKGNLLVASLREQTLYRVVLDGDRERVVYVEPLRIGRRLRDLIERPEGDIWLWADTGELITISIRTPSHGEAVFAGCASCHSRGNNAGGMAPGLGGIVGSVVASRPGYDYSPALKVLGGRWTEERLDAFLADPGAVAPGSRMSYRVPGSEDRAAVIAFLRDLP